MKYIALWAVMFDDKVNFTWSADTSEAFTFVMTPPGSLDRDQFYFSTAYVSLIGI